MTAKRKTKNPGAMSYNDHLLSSSHDIMHRFASYFKQVFHQRFLCNKDKYESGAYDNITTKTCFVIYTNLDVILRAATLRRSVIITVSFIDVITNQCLKQI